MKQPACARCIRSRSSCSLLYPEANAPYSIADYSSGAFHESHTVTPPDELLSISISLERKQRGYHNCCEAIPFNSLSSALAAPSNLHLKDLADLELFHHFRTAVSFSLSSIAPKQQVWQFPVSREALKFEFLMHAILALAAANLMSLHCDQRQFYEKIAKTHQNIAFQSSLPYFQDITPTNCHALFAFSNIVAPLTSAFIHGSISTLRSDSLDMILDFFSLLRGIQILLRCAPDWITEGPLAELVNHDWNPPQRPLPVDVKAAFQSLDLQNEEISTDSEDPQLYASPIRLLKKAFQTYQIIAEEPGMVLIWPIVVPESYIAAIKRREPFALVILAHFSVLLHGVHNCWWLEGRGAGLIETIARVLPSEWLPSIQWPLAVDRENWKQPVDKRRDECL